MCIYFTGETEFSFGYANNGKKCYNRTFDDYGDSFEKGDSIAAYVDFETDPSSVIVSYGKNGVDQGVAFRIKRSDLGENENAVFYPHVLSKNCVFEMNFGQRVSLIGDEPFAPIKSDFELIQKRPMEARVSNAPRKTNKSDYEVGNIETTITYLNNLST